MVADAKVVADVVADAKVVVDVAVAVDRGAGAVRIPELCLYTARRSLGCRAVRAAAEGNAP